MLLPTSQLIELHVVDAIYRETARRTLKNALKPWLKRCWGFPFKANAELIAAWRAGGAVPTTPRLGTIPGDLDKTSKQVLSEVRKSLQLQPSVAAAGNERHGMADMLFAPLERRCDVDVPARRIAMDFALIVRDLGKHASRSMRSNAFESGRTFGVKPSQWHCRVMWCRGRLRSVSGCDQRLCRNVIRWLWTRGPASAARQAALIPTWESEWVGRMSLPATGTV